MTQTADALIAELGESVEAVRAHLSTLDERYLESLMDRLSKTVTPGSAETVVLVHLYREIGARRFERGEVIYFPTR